MRRKNIAICGLDCSSCAAFIATQNNNNKLREKTAKEWSERYKSKGLDRPPLKPEDINCRGCLSEDGPAFLYCLQCEVRICGLEKKIKNCGECKEYRCDKLVKLHKRTTSGKEICDKIKQGIKA